MMPKIGITERGNAGLDFSWISKSEKYIKSINKV